MKAISIISSFIIAFIIFLLDQITKYAVKINVHPLDIIEVLPFFNIVYVENIGSAFGMFKSLGNIFFVVVALAAVIIVSFLIVKDYKNRLAFSMILGGAAGNLMDRLIYGYVIDFLDVHIGKYHWPAFNIADSALTIGIVILFIKTIFQDNKKNKKKFD